jgi:hypothetical protein
MCVMCVVWMKKREKANNPMAQLYVLGENPAVTHIGLGDIDKAACRCLGVGSAKSATDRRRSMKALAHFRSSK